MERLGIVFAGGAGPDPGLLARMVAAAGAESGGLLTAAADSGLLLAEAAGVRPDWIVGDMDSLGDEGRLRLAAYPEASILSFPEDKDNTDTEIALDVLWSNGCRDVWIVGGGGGRLAHLLGIRDLFERPRFPRRWITAAEDVYCVDGDGMAMELEIGDLVSVFPLAEGPWRAESWGLKWPLSDTEWRRGSNGISNVAGEREVEIRSVRGRFMVVLEGICQQL